MESSQQPAEESSPLRSEEADEEVDHSGDEDDTRRNVVQVVESLLIGHHIQVSAGYTHTHTRTLHSCTYDTTNTAKTTPTTNNNDTNFNIIMIEEDIWAL